MAHPTIDTFVHDNEQRLLDELLALLRIPSISTAPEPKPDVQKAAQYVADALGKAGLENIEIIPPAGHPLVYADWMHAPGKPTVLLYGHYDVQPPDPLELWETPPFEPTIRNGNIYARGSADDKGQMYMHIKAVEALRAVNGTLPVNVKCLIEGEEEVGGASITKFVKENHQKLQADVALVADTNMYAPGLTTLKVGLRGLVDGELQATGAGSKTVIPASATAKVSIRLVPDQDPDKVIAAFEKFVAENAPRGVQMQARVLGKGPGLLVKTDHPAIQVAARAFSEQFGRETV